MEAEFSVYWTLEGVPALFRTTAGLKKRPWTEPGNFDPFVCEIIPLSGNPLDVTIFEEPVISGWDGTSEFVVVSVDNVHEAGSTTRLRPETDEPTVCHHLCHRVHMLLVATEAYMLTDVQAEARVLLV